MTKYIKKLFYSSVIALMSVGINFETEARVTREVAEATLPYLMEAAGIPQDTRPNPDSNPNMPYYNRNKLDAIISMIYTDEGQQQMVNWAVNDVRPQILEGERSPFSGIWPAESSNIEKENGERLFQILFPCNTNTFTSVAANSNRLGYYALKYGLVELVGATVFNIGQIAELRANPKIRREATTLDDILTRLTGETIDLRIAKIIFLLDICDTLDQLKNIYNQVTSKTIAIGMDRILTKYNEYDCRPVPATMAQTKNNEGDCVESLYMHLIAIATQQNIAGYNCNKLPSSIRLEGNNFSGITNVMSHKDWATNITDVYLKCATVDNKLKRHMIDFISQSNKCTELKMLLDKELLRVINIESEKIKNGTLRNIVDVIEGIAFYEKNCSENEGKEIHLRLSEALTELSAVGNKFTASALSEADWDGILRPSNTQQIIKLEETSSNAQLNRTILIAICENGHAEILSIKK